MTGSPAIDLRSPGLPYARVTIAGSPDPVDVARLHADPDTGAGVSVVRFPATWRRPATGYYACAEELLVVDGTLVVTGHTYAAGVYGYLPPYATRSASATPGGCLALAWFSARPIWAEGTADGAITHPAAYGDPLGQRRPRRPDVVGESAVVAQAPVSVDVPTELVSTSSWQWALVPPGDPVPALPGPVLVRSWA